MFYLEQILFLNMCTFAMIVSDQSEEYTAFETPMENLNNFDRKARAAPRF